MQQIHSPEPTKPMVWSFNSLTTFTQWRSSNSWPQSLMNSLIVMEQLNHFNSIIPSQVPKKNTLPLPYLFTPISRPVLRQQERSIYCQRFNRGTPESALTQFILILGHIRSNSKCRYHVTGNPQTALRHECHRYSGKPPIVTTRLRCMYALYPQIQPIQQWKLDLLDG